MDCKKKECFFSKLIKKIDEKLKAKSKNQCCCKDKKDNDCKNG